jgi:hypothetical protein
MYYLAVSPNHQFSIIDSVHTQRPVPVFCSFAGGAHNAASGTITHFKCGCGPPDFRIAIFELRQGFQVASSWLRRLIFKNGV